MKRLLLLSSLVLALALACATAPEAPPPADPHAVTHKFEEVAPGVYFVAGTGVVNVGSNSLVVVNERDVLVVDSHITPDAARALIAWIQTISDKPIRTVVNSHFHYDHVHGNQAFGPDVEIIGHEFTRMKLAGDVLNEDTYRMMGSPAAQARNVERLERELAEAAEADKPALQMRLNAAKRHVKALEEIKPTPPTRTLTDSLTLRRGSREIQVRHLGRGHTGGDVVVYLPAEKVLFTGDLFYDGAPYLGDSYPLEFIDTLEKLKEIDFDVIVGGHGPLVRDRSKIDFRQKYIREYYDQVKGFYDQGLTEEQAIEKVDLSAYGKYAASRRPSSPAFRLEVLRMYHRLQGGE